MNSVLIKYEVSESLRKPSFWLSASLVAGVSFVLVHIVTVGLPFVRIQFVGEEFVVNSIRNVDTFATVMSWLMIFLIANAFAFQANRDFAHNSQALVFSTGVSKSNYLSARFTAAFVECLLLALSSFIGFFTARYMPYIDPSYFQTDTLFLYGLPFLIKTLPNIFILGAIFFSLNLVMRHQLINWVSVMALYLLSVAMMRLADTDWQILSYLAEPLGMGLTKASRGIENGQFVYDIYLLGNRLIWICLATVILILSIVSFQLNDEPSRKLGNNTITKLFYRLFPRGYSYISNSNTNALAIKAKPIQNKLNKTLIKTFSSNTQGQTVKVWLSCLWFELSQIVLNRYFLLLNFLGFSYLFWVSRLIGRTFETNTFPVTYKVLEVFQGTFGLFFFAIIILFGAEALWRDRDVKVDGITGTFPVSTAHYLSAKAAALFITLALLSSAMMLGGILVQKMRGYFHHEIGLYAINLFGLGFVDFVLIVALTFMVFSLVRNKYQGYAVMGAYYVFDNFATNALLQHKLLIFGAAPSLVYSDLNGFGPNVFPYLVFKIFWCLVALCLVRVSVWVWQRSDGERAPLQKIIKEKIAQTPRRSFALAGAIVACASFILYNTLILNTFVTASGAEKKQARYEKTYGQFVAESQPDIVQLSMALEIEPDSARVHGNISAWLTNNSHSTIEQLHLEFDHERIHNVKFDREAKLVVTDIELGVFRWALTKPLFPGERIAVSFIVDDYQVGFANNGRNTEVVDNGTFYQPPIPKVGYQSSQEITDGRRRKAFDLKEKPDFISRDSEGVETRSFLGLEQSFIELEITLGTTLDQRAFAPGDLVNEWRKNGRAYFKYVSQQKVLNFISIVSGRYAHSQSTWMAEGNMHHPVELSVYHHPKHNANTDAMLEASEMAMDDFTRRFGPYPHNQLRILEFPRYADFAQSFAANIPFSESIGFIADVSGIENNVGTDFSDATIDYPFFVTAHEIAHQWWAHQLSAADAEGANFLIESISQYSALRVYERKYGASGVRKLLRYYSNKYGIERTVARTGSRERPLLRVRNGQDFVHYAKGISALYAVSEQIGEVTFDAAVKEFLKNFSYKNRQYPTTQDFMDTLLSYADVNTHDYINEQLEQITLMSYNVEMPTYHRLTDFSYKITASIEFKKQFQLDDGTLIEAASETLVDVGFYNANGEEIDVVQLPLTNGQNKVEVKLPRKPSTLVIEPYFKWQELNVIKEEITLLPSGT